MIDKTENKTLINIHDDVNRFPLFNKVRHDHDISVYIEEQNKSMNAMGFTEHSFAHIGVVTDRTGYILDTLGVDDHTIDLALTAAWMHDLGNVVNRVDHSQSGALFHGAYALMQKGCKIPGNGIPSHYK